MTSRILILGGTSESRQLAQQLATRTDLSVTLSLAGRTASPLPQLVPVRTGGFGGVAGLVDYLRANHIAVLIDATHPYAATISANALQAATHTGTSLLVLRRAPWRAQPGDCWSEVADAQEAARALDSGPLNVFLTLGRQELAPFAHQPQHRYLIRSVDPVEPRLAVPQARYVLDRGPFDEHAERELMSTNAIDVVVAKNSGGAATYAKIAAARALGIRVLLLRRPPQSGRAVGTVAEAVASLDQALLDHTLALDMARGV